MMNEDYGWVKTYNTIAKAILGYKNKRKELLKGIYDIFKKIDIKNNYLEDKINGISYPFEDICPFTVMGIFNRNNTEANRKIFIKEFASFLNINVEIPDSFLGIPVLNGMRSWFFGRKEERRTNDINNLWDMFEIALQYVDDKSQINKDKFIKLYDTVVQQPCVKWNLTMGLYWINAEEYLTLDGNSREYIVSELKLADKLNNIPSGIKYLNMAEKCKDIFSDEKYGVHSFYEMSYNAWINSNKDDNIYWLGGATYSVGDVSQDFINNGVYAIDFGNEDISNIVSNQLQLKEWINSLESNTAKKTFELFCQMKRGDTIAIKAAYAKGSVSMVRIKAIGIILDSVADGYQYDEHLGHTIPVEWEVVTPNIDYELGGYMKTIHMVTKKQDIDAIFGSKENPNDVNDYYSEIISALKSLDGKAMLKDICDEIEKKDILPNIHTTNSWRNIVNAYMQYKCSDSPKYQGKEDLFTWDKETRIWGLRNQATADKYTEADFLNDIYMKPQKYELLKTLLLEKKNIILQGAPGVGKSYLAQKLVYSIMGVCDTSRVCMIQFHQSYSYEDFIEGYRPTAEGGFELKEGVFKEFVGKAKNDPENKYFFIIDEINRGNLSKIFGELMLLIENDKRNEKYKMTTTYGSRNFYVPENIHIIGLMNTADRSLAMLDYALRRRFSFITIDPAFDNDKFIADITRNDIELGKTILSQMTKLNQAIKDDLGAGYRIGHSYFCNCDNHTIEWYERILRYEILPLLEEYWFDNEEKYKAHKKELLPNDSD